MEDDGWIKDRLSPFNPKGYMQMGRILHVLYDSLNKCLQIQENRGELKDDEVEDLESVIDCNVKEICLALTGKKYIAKRTIEE